MYHRLSYVFGGIFGRLDIMYYRPSYVSGGAVPFKSLGLYIYWSRGTMKSSNHSTNSILLHGIEPKLDPFFCCLPSIPNPSYSLLHCASCGDRSP
jgi:hypothetical protein